MRYLIALALFGITSACTQEAAPAVPPGHEMVPLSVFDLNQVAGRSLDPQKLTVVDDSTWFAADLAKSEVWKFSLHRTGIVAGRVWHAGDSDTERPIAFGASRSEIGILTKGAALLVLDAVSGKLKHRLVISANRARLLGLYAAEDGAWLLVEQRMMRSDSFMRDSLFLRRIESTGLSVPLWSAEKSRLSNVADVIADVATATARDGAIFVGLASPPRVIRLRVDSSHVNDVLLPLSNAPQRQLSAADLSRAHDMLAHSGEMKDTQLPTLLPAVTRAWPVLGGYLVLAASSFDDFAVDLYCGTSFRRTVLTGVADAVVLPTMLVARSKRPDRGVDRFETYPLDRLAVSCA